MVSTSPSVSVSLFFSFCVPLCTELLLLVLTTLASLDEKEEEEEEEEEEEVTFAVLSSVV